MIILYIFGIVALLNLIFWWCKRGRELGVEKVTKIGRLDVRVGIEAPNDRDFDLTICWHPLCYITFQLSLWTIYCGFGWSSDPVSWPDCDHEGIECHSCGCKNRCGEKDSSGK